MQMCQVSQNQKHFSRCALHSFCRATSRFFDFVFLAELIQGLDVVAAAGHVSTR